MMHAHPSGARYLAGEGYQVVQLPYVGETAAMTILVPDHGNFIDFESQLTGEMLAETMLALSPVSL